MPIRNFDGVDDRVTTAGGSVNLTGAFSLAFLFRLDTIGRAHTLMLIRDSAVANRIAVGIQANNLFVFDVNGDGLTATQSDQGGGLFAQAGRWYLYVGTKPAGAGAQPKFHIKDYTAGTWYHADGSHFMNDAASQAGGTVVFGELYGNTWPDVSQNWLDGDLAAAAAWSVALSDAQCESLGALPDLGDWTSFQSPLAVWHFNQFAVTTTVQDIVGAADESSRVGTAVLIEDAEIPYESWLSPPGIVFEDDFESGIDAGWNLATNVTAVGNHARIQVNSAYTGRLRRTGMALRGTEYSFQVLNAPENDVTDAAEMGIELTILDQVNMIQMFKAGATLWFREKVASANSDTNIPYDATAHRWWKVAIDSAGTITWQTSPDRETWTVRRTKAAAVDVDALVDFDLWAGHWAGTAPTSAFIVDNVRVVGPLPRRAPAGMFDPDLNSRAWF